MNITELTKRGLLHLIDEYDKYIQSANDDNQYATGWKPVCIEEFADNEFREMLENERGVN